MNLFQKENEFLFVPGYCLYCCSPLSSLSPMIPVLLPVELGYYYQYYDRNVSGFSSLSGIVNSISGRNLRGTCSIARQYQNNAATSIHSGSSSTDVVVGGFVLRYPGTHLNTAYRTAATKVPTLPVPGYFVL